MDKDRVRLAIARVPLTQNIPSKHDHITRSHCNTRPDGELIYVKNHPTRRKWRIYKDLSDREWLKVPWYFNMFHKPWAYRKFIYLDKDVLENGIGSSEVQMDKKTRELLDEDSYNYRDFSTVGHWRHFKADIFPVILYRRC